MGNKNNVFEPEMLEEYQECTFFTQKQIRRLYKRFAALNTKKINKHKADVHTRLTFSEVQQLPALQENPFRYRICQVFSSSGNGLSFEDFLDMCSVFSDAAPWELKSTYAFRIYDFDSDAFLSHSDIEETLLCITGDKLTSDEITTIVNNVIKEVDIDQDEKLSYAEFEHVVSRSPDFVTLFRLTI
jgi:calcium and integrin-binding protein 1